MIKVLGLTVLGSGSSGNALIVHGRRGDILFDAGFSLRQLRARMQAVGIDESRLRAIVVSHEHGDHTSGLKPASRHYGLPLYCTRNTGEALRERGLVTEQLRLFAAGASFQIEDFCITPFSIPHDASDPVGFAVECDGLKLGLATDLGYVSSVVSHHLQACDVLVLESNHDVPLLHASNRPWRLKQRILGRRGHLSNEDCMGLLRQVLHPRTRQVVLAHASRDCNCYELVETLVARHLGQANRQDVVASVARQDCALPTIWVGAGP